eukprot:5803583-Amphidinium_carterae.1
MKKGEVCSFTASHIERFPTSSAQLLSPKSHAPTGYQGRWGRAVEAIDSALQQHAAELQCSSIQLKGEGTKKDLGLPICVTLCPRLVLTVLVDEVYVVLVQPPLS